MSDIFISYARADKERAKLLAEAFSRQGWSVWWDREIPPGRSFDETIENALNSARCVIVLWSKDSVSSRWVRTETAEGAARGILVPVLIEQVPIPLEFKRIEAADLSDWQGTSPHFEFDQLLKIVASILGGSAPTEVKQIPTNTKLRSRRWWTTKLGLVTATAGIITAVTGLLVVLNQAGVFDTERNRVPQAQNATITSTEATKPLAVTGTGPSATESPSPGQTVPYPITLSAGAEVKLGDYVYKILAAQLDRDSAEKLRLRFTVRMMNNSGYGANFWDDTFRLLVDGVPRAPISNLNELVPSRSAKEGDVVFVIPEATKSTVLQVWSRGESTEIPIDIAAKPDLAEQRDRYSLIFVTEAAPNTALNSDAPNSGAPVSLAR